MLKPPSRNMPKFGGISHRGDVPAGAIGGSTLGQANMQAGLPRNPLSMGEASQAVPMTTVEQNPIGATMPPKNEIARFPQ